MKTARAVVIDEDPKEALSLLQALGQLGWSSVYVAGDDETLLPTHPLDGIRLVFLDLKLINLPEARQYLPHTIRVLERVVKMIPGVTGLLCWTTHDDEEEIALLKEELAKRSLVPAFVEAIREKRAITQSGKQGIDRLTKTLQEKAVALPGRALLMQWEERLHEGATAATNGLYKLGNEDQALLKILGSIAVAAAEERIDGSQTALDSLFDGLSAIHIDALENVHDSQSLKEIGDALCGAVQESKNERLPAETIARLNAVLLTTDRAASDQTARPGNVYVPSTWDTPENFPYVDGKYVRGLIREVLKKRKGTPEDDEFVKVAEQDVVPCLVEITPVCDHVQRKIPDARLLGGLLIKSPTDVEVLKQRELPADSRLFAKEYEYVWIENEAAKLDGSYKLIVTARRLITRPISDLEKHAPLFRLRHPVISDLCAWFGAHAARPGYVSVH